MSDNQNVIEFLKTDIARTRSATRRWMIGGGGLILFMIGYLSWMTGNVRELTNPETVAGIIVEKAVRATPALAENSKKSLIETAPQTVDSVGMQTIESIPVVRLQIQEKVDSFLDIELMRIRAQVDASFEDVILAHQDQIRATLRRMKNPDETGDVSKELIEQMIVSFRESMRNVTGLESDQVVNQSQAILEGIRNDLKRIESGENLSPDDKRLRHFIQLLYVHAQRAHAR